MLVIVALPFPPNDSIRYLNIMLLLSNSRSNINIFWIIIQNLPGMGGVFNVVNLHVYYYAGNNPVKYVDPDGEWTGKVHYNVTTTWATQLHMRTNYAEIVAKANKDTDSGKTGPTYKTGRPLHFNTKNTPETFRYRSSSQFDGDSRKQFSDEAFGTAVAYINIGRIEEGLEIFGRGLHALQDMYAHSDEFVGYQAGKWSHLVPGIGNPPVPSNGNDADKPHKNPLGYERTQEATEKAIIDLKNSINEDARKKIFYD